MPKTKELSSEIRDMILARHKYAKSSRQIPRELKISKITADYNMKKFKTLGSVRNKKRCGRPRTAAEDKKVVIASKRNRLLSAPEIAVEFRAI